MRFTLFMHKRQWIANVTSRTWIVMNASMPCDGWQAYKHTHTHIAHIWETKATLLQALNSTIQTQAHNSKERRSLTEDLLRSLRQMLNIIEHCFSILCYILSIQFDASSYSGIVQSALVNRQQTKCPCIIKSTPCQQIRQFFSFS